MDATTDRTDDLTTTEPVQPAGSEKAAPHGDPATHEVPEPTDAPDAEDGSGTQGGSGPQDATAGDTPPADVPVEGTLVVDVVPAPSDATPAPVTDTEPVIDAEITGTAPAAVEPPPGTPPPVEPPPGTPTPGRLTPGAGGDEPAATEADLAAAAAFGRVAEDGAVFVRSRIGERQVGSWAVGEQQEALTFFARRFVTLRTEVALAETRVRAGSLTAESAQSTVHRLRDAVETAQAVGDLDELALRVDALDGLVAVARERRRTEKAAETAAARERKAALVAEAEGIGAGQNWRVGPEMLRLLFEEWKGLPRLDKATDDELWKRFSAARSTYTRRRKAHYAELTASRELVQNAKEALITEAEVLAPSTEWGPTTAQHRVLMERWKAAGSAAKDVDDALWERFRAARQSFFEAREAHDAQRTGSERENLAAKEALLTEAEALLPVTDMRAARRTMRGIRERWEAVGHVPRGSVASVDTRLKVVDDALRGAETQEWRRTDPEALRRAERTAEQLRPAIARLEKDVTAARGRGDATALRDAEESLSARRQWLVQAERIISESR